MLDSRLLAARSTPSPISRVPRGGLQIEGHPTTRIQLVANQVIAPGIGHLADLGQAFLTTARVAYQYPHARVDLVFGRHKLDTPLLTVAVRVPCLAWDRLLRENLRAVLLKSFLWAQYLYVPLTDLALHQDSLRLQLRCLVPRI